MLRILEPCKPAGVVVAVGDVEGKDKHCKNADMLIPCFTDDSRMIATK